ncbi:MAG: iron chelate uptake ABC transporter family permease subunit [Gammaproteobacteria bacterium]|nr:iron chelate uptake ABC transporter family permease subunit [Gammaproteobacteria bacterium]MXY31144.1 iron ABC transporter permease [Gammaproteobacteria bacterium]MYF61848.1 iron ABC transporter permease [Gammaproteobacteria bacterium]
MSARVNTSGAILLTALAALSLLTLTYGQIALPLADTVGALTGSQSTDLARQIVLDIRLPRVAAAIIAGGALGMAGVLMQALFRNPVADAWSLGLLAGGQLGVALTVTAAAFAGPAAVSILTFFEGPSITLAAATGVAIAAVVMLALGRRVGAITLLVIGLMLGFTSQGLTSVLLHFAARAGGRIYGGWTDASFAGVAPEVLPWLGLPILVGTCAAVATAKPLSSLLLGETYARSLGVKVTSLRHAVLAAAVLLVAPVVAFCGPVSFVGLIAPHFARALAGTARILPLLPLAALGGALLALAGDAIIHAPWEQHFLHLNAILAIVGAPAVILILIFSPAVRQWR